MRRHVRRICAFLTLVGVTVELAMLAFHGNQTVGVLVGLGTVATGAASWKLDPTV
jgi:hypothetical protein